jgi:hypothetical protein
MIETDDHAGAGGMALWILLMLALMVPWLIAP